MEESIFTKFNFQNNLLVFSILILFFLTSSLIFIQSVAAQDVVIPKVVEPKLTIPKIAIPTKVSVQLEPRILFDKTSYTYPDTIHLRIYDSKNSGDIPLAYKVFAPNGNLVYFSQINVPEIAPGAGIYEIDIDTGPINVKMGTYTTKVSYHSVGFGKTVQNYFYYADQPKISIKEPPSGKLYLAPSIGTKVFDLATSLEPSVYAAKKMIPYDPVKNQVRLMVKYDNPATLTAITNLQGVNVETSQTGISQITIPLDLLGNLADMPGVKSAEPPIPLQQHDILSEGIPSMHIERAHSQGLSGEGIGVAVLDLAFDINNPEISSNINPADVRKLRRDFNGIPFPTIGLGTEAQHGTAVCEIIVDVAPKVQLYPYTIATELEFLEAIDDILKNRNSQIDVITMSAGFIHHLADGSSQISKKLAEAANTKSVIISAGNYRLTHWEGKYADFTRDVRELIIPVTARTGKPIVLVLLWTVPSEDYNLILKNPEGVKVDLSVNNQLNGNPNNFEVISFVPDTTGNYKLEIIYESENPSRSTLEIFGAIEERFNQFTPQSSSSVPTDALNVITVGALNSITNQLQDFSSEGPTTTNQQVPKILGPDSVRTMAYGNTVFDGTSAATPHIAGLVALLLEKNPNMLPNEIYTTLYNHAQPIQNPSSNNPGNRAATADFIPESTSIPGSDTVPEPDTFPEPDTVPGPTSSTSIIESRKIEIPNWIKDTLEWWVNGSTSDREFVDMIEKLIELGTIIVPEIPQESTGSKEIPSWIKTNTRWWISNQISDTEFALGIEFLIKEGVITVSKN